MQERFRKLDDGGFECLACGTHVTERTDAGEPVPCPTCLEVERLETVRQEPFSPDELRRD